MALAPFDAAHAPLVSSWARSEQEVLAWCSRTEVPVPATVISSWAAAPDVAAYVLVDDATRDGSIGDGPIGYGELWVDDDEAEVELARLIIDPSRRGQGYGRRMVAELVTLAQQHYRSVNMRVHPDNVAAMHSYAAAGFAPVSASEAAQWNVGQPIAYAWMAFRDR